MLPLPTLPAPRLLLQLALLVSPSLLLVALGACSATAPKASGPGAVPAVDTGPPTVDGMAGEQAPTTLDATGTFLQPNVSIDGRPGFVHVTSADMPWRIAVGVPVAPPRRGSLVEAREAAIEGMQLWEEALRPKLPWFRLEFVPSDPEAPVQVRWRHSIVGNSWGWGQLQWWTLGPELRVGGLMKVSTTPSPTVRLSAWDLRRIVAHEFGHVLGLGHCLDCDSVMSYALDPVREPRVTETDVRTFLALLERPNGSTTIE